MRYSLQHKHATRFRIVREAGRAFRERGVSETGLDEIMRRVGLTHGGFYAHFKSKDDLVAEACAAAFEDAAENLDRIALLTSATSRVRLLVDSYLSVHHRDHRGSGCIVVAVAADIARLGGAAKTAYSRSFARHLDRLAAALRLGPDPESNRERTSQLLGSLVGTLLIARATEDDATSRAILHGARRRLRAEFSSTSVSAAPPQRRVSNDFLMAFTELSS